MFLSLENECSSFNSEKGGAGWDRWLGFKATYGSVMRQPESLSMNKAQASSQENIERFYDNLKGLRKTGLVNKQERTWNIDERGFSFVIKLQKVVSPKGAVTIYQQTTAEKGETSTVLLTINLLEIQVFPWDIQGSTTIRWSSKISTSIDKRPYPSFEADSGST